MFPTGMGNCGCFSVLEGLNYLQAVDLTLPQLTQYLVQRIISEIAEYISQFGVTSNKLIIVGAAVMVLLMYIRYRSGPRTDPQNRLLT